PAVLGRHLAGAVREPPRRVGQDGREAALDAGQVGARHVGRGQLGPGQLGGGGQPGSSGRRTERILSLSRPPGPGWPPRPMPGFVVKPLGPDTWDAFAGLAERHNGVWGGCWCTWFHPACAEKGVSAEGNRALKRRLVDEGRAHTALVFDGDAAVA